MMCYFSRLCSGRFRGRVVVMGRSGVLLSSIHLSFGYCKNYTNLITIINLHFSVRMFHQSASTHFHNPMDPLPKEHRCFG